MSHKQLFIGYCIRFFDLLRWNVIIRPMPRKDFVKKVHLRGFVNEPTFLIYVYSRQIFVLSLIESTRIIVLYSCGQYIYCTSLMKNMQ